MVKRNDVVRARVSAGRARAWVAAALALLVVAGCAAVTANRRSPGVLSGSSFSPARAAATQYEPNAELACPRTVASEILADNLESFAKSDKKPAPQADGRLCAVAEAFLGWDEKQVPPESVKRFVAGYFGLPERVQRLVITTLETEDGAAIAQRVLQPASSFASNATAPRYGFVTQRVRKGLTKVALAMVDSQLELEPVPRRVPAGAPVVIAGRTTGGVSHPRVLLLAPGGALENPAAQPGTTFRAETRCGDKPGPLLVEIRGEKQGAPVALANFAVTCGSEPPTSVAVTPPESGVVDARQMERKLFELVNADRRAAGLPALTWDDAIAQAARTAATSLQNGTINPSEVVEALKKADIASPLVLQNPMLATTVEEANANAKASPVDRANELNREVTHVGIGVVPGTTPDGMAVVYVTEVFVREQSAVDVAEVRTKLRGVIATRRADARAGPLGEDRQLDTVAEEYAKELAATRGAPRKAREDQIIAPLYKVFRTVNIMAGVKLDPLEFAQEPGVLGDAKVVGVGAALGTSPSLGKNSVFVVVITGTRR